MTTPVLRRAFWNFGRRRVSAQYWGRYARPIVRFSNQPSFGRNRPGRAYFRACHRDGTRGRRNIHQFQYRARESRPYRKDPRPDGADVIGWGILLPPTPSLSSILLANRKGRLSQSSLELRAISVCDFPGDYLLRRANRLKHRDSAVRPIRALRLYLHHFRYCFRILCIDSSWYSVPFPPALRIMGRGGPSINCASPTICPRYRTW